ncbi:hypothetical protein D3C73_1366090 [compost metagenome]
MLTSSGLRNDPLRSHPLGEQNLPQHVVDFVRAGMVQILALQINFGSAQLRCQMLSVGQRIFSADILS